MAALRLNIEKWKARQGSLVLRHSLCSELGSQFKKDNKNSVCACVSRALILKDGVSRGWSRRTQIQGILYGSLTYSILEHLGAFEEEPSESEPGLAGSLTLKAEHGTRDVG